MRRGESSFEGLELVVLNLSSDGDKIFNKNAISLSEVLSGTLLVFLIPFSQASYLEYSRFSINTSWLIDPL